MPFELEFLPEMAITDEELSRQTTATSGDPVFHPSDVSTADIMNAMEASGVLGFWNDPEEDVYDAHESEGC